MKTTTKVCPRFSNKKSQKASVQATVNCVLSLHNIEIKSSNMKKDWFQLFLFANSEDLKTFTAWSKYTSLVRKMKDQHTACILEINIISAAHSTVHSCPRGAGLVCSPDSQTLMENRGEDTREKSTSGKGERINLFILPSLNHFRSGRVLILTVN